MPQVTQSARKFAFMKPLSTQRYITSADLASTFVTVFVLLLVGITLIALSTQLQSESAAYQPIYYYASFVLLTLLPLTLWLAAPRGYSLNAEGITIHRLLGSIHIPTQQIKSIEKIETGRKGFLRLFGNGGLFGYYGTYRHADYGRVKMWVRNYDNLLLVHTQDRGTYALSADDSAFYPALKKVLGGRV